ncbi:hypothetical protein [Vibrio mediterranei]
MHVAIQDAMGWLDYHLHEFFPKKLAQQKVRGLVFQSQNMMKV